MSEYRPMLERLRGEFREPQMRLEDILRRRDVRRRNDRIAAGVVVFAAVLVVALILLHAFNGSAPRPANPPSPQVLREGEILSVRDHRGRTAALLAVTPESQAERRLISCADIAHCAALRAVGHVPGRALARRRGRDLNGYG